MTKKSYLWLLTICPRDCTTVTTLLLYKKHFSFEEFQCFHKISIRDSIFTSSKFSGVLHTHTHPHTPHTDIYIEREREREKETETETETERQRDRDRETERHREIQRQRDRQRERERDRGRERNMYITLLSA